MIGAGLFFIFKNCYPLLIMENNKKSLILKWSLILSIIIVLNLFFNVALDLVYGSPKYEDFCPTEQITKQIENQNECIEQGGSWNEYPAAKYIDERPESPRIEGYCDQQFTCRQEFDDARENYERNIFISLIALGVITLVASLVLKSNLVLSNAFALAAVLDFVIASIRYWSSAHQATKVVILAIALVALIYIAYKKFNDKIS